MRLITSVDHLPPHLAASLDGEERACIERLDAEGGLPLAVTPHFASLAGTERGDPVRRQFIPSPEEFRPDPFAREDPLGEALYRVCPRLIHQYPDRALLLAGGVCAGYCRFCFRRTRMSASPAFISDDELRPVCAYLKSRPEIREVLVSGGDPLTASNTRLEGLFARLREARPGLSLRIGARVPVTAPERLDSGTAAFLARWKPLRAAVHINHPRELSAESRRALSALTGEGIPVLVQTVLLRGVNDHAGTLAELFLDFSRLGLTPYYLFQLDLAPGTAHFRVPLREGLALYGELCRRAGEGAMAEIKEKIPPYAVDLPGGGGKVRLSEASIAGEKDTPAGKVFLLKGPGGRLWPYPA